MDKEKFGGTKDAPEEVGTPEEVDVSDMEGSLEDNETSTREKAEEYGENAMGKVEGFAEELDVSNMGLQDYLRGGRLTSLGKKIYGIVNKSKGTSLAIGTRAMLGLPSTPPLPHVSQSRFIRAVKDKYS